MPGPYRMQQREIKGLNRVVIIAVIGAIVLVAALVLNYFVYLDRDEPVQQAAKTPPQAAGVEASRLADGRGAGGGHIGLPAPGRAGRKDIPAPESAGRSRAPSFDIVRVSPDGSAVIAGRAVPGSQVTVLDAGKPIGKVVADGRGEWVLVPSKPLPPGGRRLGLRAKLPDGTVLEAVGEIVLIVPERGRDVAGRKVDRPSGAIALKVPKSTAESATPGPQASIVLQKPGAGGRAGERAAAPPSKPPMRTEPKAGTSSKTAAAPVMKVPPGAVVKDVLSVDVIDYDDSGRVSIGGMARPGARVRIYIDNTPLGDTVADGRGRWSFRPDEPLKPGTYRLRVDELRARGQVARRIEIPFRRAPAIGRLPEGGIAVVQPGNTLWRIARDTYGRGIQYTVIYGANKDQIRDPDLIYPGQIFTLPKPGAVN